MKTKTLASVLFWAGVVAIPVSILFWFLQPNFARLDFINVADPAIRKAFELSSSQRLAIFIGLWPPTLFILSNIINKSEIREEISDIIGTPESPKKAQVNPTITPSE